jgi:Fanconi anemia group M protein
MKRIIADCRENAEELIGLLESRYGFDIVEKQLSLGDYFIAPDTIVERKTVADFAISIIDGRLFRQAYLLAECAENPLIIIEGETFDGLNVPINAIKGALISLAQSFRLPVLRTKNQKDSAWYINQLDMQRQRIGKNKGSLHLYNPKKIDTQKQYVLRAFPGIGPKLAKSLIDHFGTIRAIVNADEKEIAMAPGIGKAKASKISSILREESAKYMI